MKNKPKTEEKTVQRTAEPKKERAIMCVCAGTFPVDGIIWARKKIQDLKEAGLDGFHLVTGENPQYLYVGRLSDDPDEIADLIQKAQDNGHNLTTFNM